MKCPASTALLWPYPLTDNLAPGRMSGFTARTPVKNFSASTSSPQYDHHIILRPPAHEHLPVLLLITIIDIIRGANYTCDTIFIPSTFSFANHQQQFSMAARAKERCCAIVVEAPLFLPFLVLVHGMQKSSSRQIPCIPWTKILPSSHMPVLSSPSLPLAITPPRTSGALIIRIGFGGPIVIIRNPQNSIGNYEGPYSTLHWFTLTEPYLPAASSVL